MGIVTELLDFNKVRRFQEFCGIVATKDDDPRGIDAVMSESNPERKNKNVSTRYRITYPWLHNFFMVGSSFGDEIFYITYLPILFWCFEHYTGTRIVQIWVVTMYLGQVLKEILQMPRPTCPPAFPMENQHKAEFGFPSTHATAASALSFGTLFCLIGRYNFSVSLGYLIATWHTTWVCVSRIYKGMHSILDILGGLTISFLYITIGWKYLNEVQLYIATNTFSPVVVMLANFCSGWFYPGGNCASRKDTVMILGVGAGVNVATWSNYQLGLDYDSFTTPELHFLFFRIIHGLIIVFLVRDFMKSAMKKVLSQIHGPITDKNIKDRGIEVPLTFSIYSVIGFTVSFIIPAVNAQLGLYR